jgi:hypothetical protein
MNKWQSGDYARHNSYQLTIPTQLLMMCRLLEITPRQLIIDFMDVLSCGSWKREGRQKCRETLIEYFIEQGYGRHIYTSADIKTMFGELDAIGSLFPKEAEPVFTELHAAWRENYHAYWFKKWYEKFNREL